VLNKLFSAPPPTPKPEKCDPKTRKFFFKPEKISIQKILQKDITSRTYKETPTNKRNYNQVHKGNPLFFFSASSPAAPLFHRRLGGLKQRAQKKAREDSFPTDEEAPTHGSAARDSAPKLGSTHLSSMKDHRRRPHR